MKIKRGEPVVHESRAPDIRLACVFEDDGQSGYLYALQHDGSVQPIKDAVQIYSVGNSANDHEHVLEFCWSDAGTQCGLLLDGAIHGFVDFDHRLVCSRLNFPPVSLWTGASRLAWRDSFANFF